jgi:hypothetical protein
MSKYPPMSDAGFEGNYNQYGNTATSQQSGLQPSNLHATGQNISYKGGVKYDDGKPDLSYVSLMLMEEVARVREFGAKKYSRNNWLKGFKYNRSIAAALRHIMAFKDGEDLDSESGLSHIGHAICCLEHLLNDFKNHKENDDRK